MINKRTIGFLLCILLVGASFLPVTNCALILNTVEFKNGHNCDIKIFPNNSTYLDVMFPKVELETSIADSSTFTRLSYLPHSPIFIYGNNGFTAFNGVNSGSGTKNDPYIINGWIIQSGMLYGGITIRNVDAYFVIRNCYIYNTARKYDGIIFINVENGVIEKNVITGNKIGIMFSKEWNSSNNVILNNSITSNSRGVSFEHALYRHSHNIITHNNISKNGGEGIYMIMSEYTEITYNNITTNGGDGVSLSMCMGGGQFNIIHHNNFIDNNGRQAFERGGPVNYWDDGYPSGGNYWCDYTGEDFFSGPDQNMPGSDDIGDTPYPIPVGVNVDRYPFMKPVDINISVNIHSQSKLNHQQNSNSKGSQQVMNSLFSSLFKQFPNFLPLIQLLL